MANSTFLPLWDEAEPALMLFDVKQDAEGVSATCWAYMKPLEKGQPLFDDETPYQAPENVPEERTLDLILGELRVWRSAS